jgi:hypothetical protein
MANILSRRALPTGRLAGLGATQDLHHRLLAALAAYSSLTLLYTWPLATHVSTHLPHDLGDPLISSWILWWHAHATPFTRTWWDGLAFFPAHGALAFSDHRVGLALVTTPLQWLGANPVTSYNVALLASFALSSAAAHALAFSLTRHHGVALIAGLVYGFNPFRLPHVGHVEIVSSYWLPLALLGLHKWLETARRRWLAGFAVAYLLQGLTCGYYLFFFTVLLGLWALWFLPRRGLSSLAQVFAAWLCGLLPLVPVLWEYWRIHTFYGFRRAIWEVELFSADVSGLLSGSPLLAGWPWFKGLSKPEGDIFPGFVAVVIVAVAAFKGPRRGTGAPASKGRRGLLWLSVAPALVALSVPLFGAWSLSLGPLRLSVSHIHKPLSLAAVLLAGYAFSAPRLIAAWRRQAAFTFYAVATVILWVFAFGPSPTVFGQRVLYKAPFSWLLWLPGFDGAVRVPARFAMLAALCLAVAAALGLHRLLRPYSTRVRALACAVLAGLIFLESRPRAFPIVEVPKPLAWPAIDRGDVMLELPLGHPEKDSLATYGSAHHGHRVVNGFSGYEPAHYTLLRLALERDDPAALTAISEHADLQIAVRADRDRWGAYLAALPGVAIREKTDAADFYFMARRQHAAEENPASVPVRRVTAHAGAADVKALTDSAIESTWTAGKAQEGTEQLTIELDEPSAVCGVRLAHGSALGLPHTLEIDVESGAGWRTVWSGPALGLGVAAALRNPRRVDIPLLFSSQADVRVVRLRQIGRDTRNPWSIAELEITGCR